MIERLQNAVSQAQQAIVQTLAVIDETRRLIEAAEEIGRPVVRLEELRKGRRGDEDDRY
jgi:hypothetical protein